MDKILYLVHSISTDYDKTWTELKTSSVDDINHQFPGVFFTFITKETLQRESLYYNKTILIFSKKLLEQENYHINLSDYNGFINEKNTYFPWQLDKAVKKYKSIFKKTNNSPMYFSAPSNHSRKGRAKWNLKWNVRVSKQSCKQANLLILWGKTKGSPPVFIM